MRDHSDGAEPHAAHEAALRLLAHRARSVQELGARLRRKGFDDGIVEAELERLTEAGLLNDVTFAESLAASLAKRGYGPRGIRVRLGSKGVDANIARSVVEELVRDEGGEIRMATAVVGRLLGDPSESDNETRAKTANRLVRKGFSPESAGVACGLIVGEYT